jgi:hypothetical protein
MIHVVCVFDSVSRTVRTQYVRLYKRVLNSPGAKELSEADKTELQRLESEQSFNNVVYFRSVAAAEVLFDSGRMWFFMHRH